jgi:hypothetical protein
VNDTVNHKGCTVLSTIPFILLLLFWNQMSNNCETRRPPRHAALAGAKLDFRVYTAPIHPPTRQYTPPPGLNHPVQASLYWHYPRIVTNGLFPHNAPVRFSLLHPSSLSASTPSVSTSFSLSVVAHLILVRFASTGKLYFSKLFLLAFSQCDWATLDLVILLKHFESTELCSKTPLCRIARPCNRGFFSQFTHIPSLFS